MAASKKSILEKAEELRVRTVRLQFTDFLGTNKNVSIPVDELPKALDGQILFDGSSIHGFVRIEESDMLLRPDLDTFALIPWKAEPDVTARLICDITNPDGSPFDGCPRTVLRRVVERARAMGYTLNAGPEAEFFLFHTGQNGVPTTLTHDEAGYFDLGPVDLGEDVRRDIVTALEDMGFDVEASHHEVAPGQHEIDFKYEDALRTADNVTTFEYVTRSVALKHGLHATFMPKPIFGINGSGMHVHLSLFKNGRNVFYDAKSKDQLSKTCRYFVGGLLKHAKGFCAITNPLVNSYKRLVPGYEAPIYICWSERNRSPLVRVPARRGEGTRVELRNPDPSCNPYLALAVIFAAGLDGIENEIEPPERVVVNVYKLGREERVMRKIPTLPGTLKDALGELQKDKLICETLGSHVLKHFVEAKTQAWEEYNAMVHQWELDRYLATH
jgi:glutamine synthetase